VDAADPGEVGKQAIHRYSEQGAVEGLEAIRGLGKGDKLAGADRREIRRMRKEQQPLATIF
jgi:hypothetical protein